MTVRVLRLLAVGLIAAGLPVLAGCGGTRPSDDAAYADPRNQPGTAGALGEAGLGAPRTDIKNQQGATTLGVNAYLWRGALDTLSFMPLASADPFGGVIITDWYQPPATPGERFKATAYILGRELRADGIRIAIFRQTLQAGQWVDADLAPNTVTDIENKILVRARELRAAAAAS
jgi:hypothetical protein